MSAYEYFGKRFGRPHPRLQLDRLRAGHFSKMGFVFYLLALTINSMTGWNMDQVIIGVGLLTIFYTLKGGLEAVVWTDVLQGFVLWVGVFVCLAYLLVPAAWWTCGGLHAGGGHHKFSLGESELRSSQPTIPVLLIYGFFWYLQKYVADQTIVQRYLIAKSDRAAIGGGAWRVPLRTRVGPVHAYRNMYLGLLPVDRRATSRRTSPRRTRSFHISSAHLPCRHGRTVPGEPDGRRHVRLGQ